MHVCSFDANRLCMLLGKKKKKEEKSLKNDFENFPPENVTTVLCIDLEMSVKAMNSDYEGKIKKKEKIYSQLSDKLTSLPDRCAT